MNLRDVEFNKYEVLGNCYDLPYFGDGSRTRERILMVSTIMFAEKGFEAVSIREIGDALGIKGASIYNHFKSKEDLWNAVLDHAMALYDLYIQSLEESLEDAGSFEEVLEAFYAEPKCLKNLFTCFAFSLLFTDQFRDARAGALFDDKFLKFGICFHKKWLDRCVEKGFIKAFDTMAVATILINSVTIGLGMKVQELLGRKIPFSPEQMFADQQNFLLSCIGKNKKRATR